MACFGNFGYKTHFKKKVLPEIEETLEMLQLTVEEGYSLHKFFSNIDADGGGDVDLEEIYKFFALDRTLFTDRIFLYFDFDGSGEIDFSEFLIGTWNFATWDIFRLIQFCYNIFDVDGSKLLDKYELDALLRMIHNVDELPDLVAQTLDQLGTDENGKVSIDRFVAFCTANKELLKPAFDIQKQIQTECFGLDFWKQKTELRTNELGRDTSIEDILLRRRKQMHEEQKRLREELLKQKHANMEEKERLKEEQRIREEQEQKRKEEEYLAKFAETELQEMEIKSNLEKAIADFEATQDEEDINKKAERKQAITKLFNEFIIAAEAASRSRESRAYAENLKEQEHKATEFFATKQGKEFLAMIARESALRHFDSKFGILSKKQLKFGELKAKGDHVAKKCKERNIEIKAAYKQERRKLAEEMKYLKEHYNLLSTKENDLCSWQWQGKWDASTESRFYFCPATGGSLWEQPFVKNYLGICMDPTCKNTAVLRCLECNMEYCMDCDVVAHSVGVSRFHAKSTPVPTEELDWRRQLKTIDNRKGMPPEYSQFVEGIIFDATEIKRRELYVIHKSLEKEMK